MLRSGIFRIVNLFDDPFRRHVGMEEVADGFGVVINFADTRTEVTGIAFHVDRVFVEVGVFKRTVYVRSKCSIVTSFRIQHETEQMKSA